MNSPRIYIYIYIYINRYREENFKKESLFPLKSSFYLASPQRAGYDTRSNFERRSLTRINVRMKTAQKIDKLRYHFLFGRYFKYYAINQILFFLDKEVGAWRGGGNAEGKLFYFISPDTSASMWYKPFESSALLYSDTLYLNSQRKCDKRLIAIKGLVYESNRSVWKLLVLNKNTWNHISVCKQKIIIK